MLLNKNASTLALSLLALVTSVGFLDKVANGADVQIAQIPESTPVFPLPTQIPQGTTVRIDGDSSMAVINQALKQRFEQDFPETRVTTATQGTDIALQSLQEGKLDLATIGRSLTAAEKSAGLEEFPLEREKIAIIVGKDNPFEGNLSFRQFAQIFRGEITDWSEVGGQPGRIYLIDRPPSSNTRQSFQSYPVFQEAEFTAAPDAVQVATDDTDVVVKQLQQDGISYGIASQVTNRDDVKIISMHKTLPDDPRYPFSQPRGYVYAKNNITPGAAAFLGFTASPLGGEVVAIAREAEVKGIEPDVAGIAPVQPSPTPTDSPVAAVTPETIAQAPDTLPPDRVATPTDRPLRGATGFWGWLLPFGVLGTAWWLYSKREAENRTWLRQRETLEVLPSSRSPVIAPDLPSSQIVTPVIESEGIGVDPIASMPVVQDYPASPVLRPDLDTLPTAETLGIIPVGSDTEIIAPDLTDLPPEAPPSDPETFAAVPSPWDAVPEPPPPSPIDQIAPDPAIPQSPIQPEPSLEAPEIESGTDYGAGYRAENYLENYPENYSENDRTEAREILQPEIEETPDSDLSAATLVGGIAGGAILAGLGSDRRDPPPQPEEFPEAEPEVAGDSASLQGTFIQETLTQASDQNISSNQEDTLIVDGVPEVETLRPEAVAPESPRIVAPDLDTYLTSDAQVTSKTISEAIIIPGETIPEETIVISEISETLPGEVIAEVTIIEQTTIEDTLLTTDLIASEVNVYETTPEPLILEVAEAPGSPQPAIAPPEMTLPGVGVPGERIELTERDDQSRVEAAKFNIGQAEEVETLETVDQDLPELPAGYGFSLIVLLPRDPNSAYVYWDIPNEDREVVRQQGGRQLALRLYDVTWIDMDHQTPHSVQQFECDEMARDWYIPVLVSDRDYIVEVGYVTEDGRWLKLARSSHVHIPPLYPSDSFDYQDMTVFWEEALRGKFFFKLDQVDQLSRPPLGAPLPVQSLSELGLTSSAEFASAPPVRPSQFWLVANAELIVHGATEPDAQVNIGGLPIQLEPDGSFRIQMPFQDGQVDSPIVAVASDEEQTRSVHFQFTRETPERKTNSRDDVPGEPSS